MAFPDSATNSGKGVKGSMILLMEEIQYQLILL